MNTQDFISKAKQKHGDKYDYSKVVYKTCNDKVCIICPEHGEFMQRPHSHLCGAGCPICGKKSSDKTRSLSKEQFIQKAQKVHGDRYDYSKVEYVNNHTKVKIICPEHGEFEQQPFCHLKGYNCPICAKEIASKKRTIGLDGFIQKAKNVHGNKYDYSKVDYVNCDEKVRIICPKHGEFEQTPYNHIISHGCPKCALEIFGEKRSNTTTESFITRAKEIHGDKYDYSLSTCNRSYDYVDIICKKHGVFKQRVIKHLSGQGCPFCKNYMLEEKVAKKLSECNISFIRQYRTQWLGLQSLDFFIPDYNCAIECQGRQHFNENSNFYTKEKYEMILERDNRKREKCKQNGIHLLYFSNKKRDCGYEIITNLDILINNLKTKNDEN